MKNNPIRSMMFAVNESESNNDIKTQTNTNIEDVARKLSKRGYEKVEVLDKLAKDYVVGDVFCTEYLSRYRDYNDSSKLIDYVLYYVNFIRSVKVAGSKTTIKFTKYTTLITDYGNEVITKDDFDGRSLESITVDSDAPIEGVVAGFKKLEVTNTQISMPSGAKMNSSLKRKEQLRTIKMPSDGSKFEPLAYKTTINGIEYLFYVTGSYDPSDPDEFQAGVHFDSSDSKGDGLGVFMGVDSTVENLQKVINGMELVIKDVESGAVSSTSLLEVLDEVTDLVSDKLDGTYNTLFAE